MNNKMAINTYLSTIESKKQTKQTRTETESWMQRTVWWLPDESCGGVGDAGCMGAKKEKLGQLIA